MCASVPPKKSNSPSLAISTYSLYSLPIFASPLSIGRGGDGGGDGDGDGDSDCDENSNDGDSDHGGEG
jgi:hypothetical protein